MYVLKKNSDTINYEQNLYRDDNDEFEWKYNDSVGAGALIPYKRGDDDVGWFICYRHS